MKEEEYIEKRVDEQINWYIAKAGTCKTYYYLTKSLIIVFSAVIPLIAGITIKNHVAKDLVVGLLGVSIAIITGFSSLFKYQDKWTEYRVTSENMIQEKILFQTLSGSYEKHPDPFRLLVSSIESLINKEHTSWPNYIKAESKEKS